MYHYVKTSSKPEVDVQGCW